MALEEIHRIKKKKHVLLTSIPFESLFNSLKIYIRACSESVVPPSCPKKVLFAQKQDDLSRFLGPMRWKRTDSWKLSSEHIYTVRKSV